MHKTVKIGKIKIGFNKPLVLIAGPCVIESYDLCAEVCEKLKKICSDNNIPYIFKASYDKANRTSINSFRGPGLKRGLKILSKIKNHFDVPIISDIHLPQEAKEAASVLDIIQIPAFLVRQTDIIISAAETGRPINIKKSQMMSPYDIKYVIEKIESVGNKNILITERGTMFGYNNLVSDFKNIHVLRKYGYPVVYDASHSAQSPGGKGMVSGGDRGNITLLAKAAVAVGVSAVFLEVHPYPKKALSDSATMLSLKDIEKLLPTLVKIYVSAKR